MARFFRDSRSGTIVAGSSEVMREIIARIMIEGAVPAKVESRKTAKPDKTRPTIPARPPETTCQEPPPAEEPVTVESLFGSLPDRLRPEKTEGWSTCFHYKIEGAAAPEWTVWVEGPSCRVAQGLEGDPKCVVEMDEETYLGVETGQVNPQVAFMMGKVKVSDISEMMHYIKAFRPVFR